MAIDEELLRPSREHLAYLGAEIKRQEALAASDIERYGYGDREYARQRWAEFSMTVEPMRRELEAVAKVIANYYALQPMPPQFPAPGQTPPPSRGRQRGVALPVNERKTPMPDSYVEKLVESIKSKIRPGQKIVIETSNETMHLDLETGEMVSDSYANETWNFTPEGNVG